MAMENESSPVLGPSFSKVTNASVGRFLTRHGCARRVAYASDLAPTAASLADANTRRTHASGFTTLRCDQLNWLTVGRPQGPLYEPRNEAGKMTRAQARHGRSSGSASTRLVLALVIACGSAVTAAPASALTPHQRFIQRVLDQLPVLHVDRTDGFRPQNFKLVFDYRALKGGTQPPYTCLRYQPSFLSPPSLGRRFAVPCWFSGALV